MKILKILYVLAMVYGLVFGVKINRKGALMLRKEINVSYLRKNLFFSKRGGRKIYFLTPQFNNENQKKNKDSFMSLFLGGGGGLYSFGDKDLEISTEIRFFKSFGLSIDTKLQYLLNSQLFSDMLIKFGMFRISREVSIWGGVGKWSEWEKIYKIFPIAVLIGVMDIEKKMSSNLYLTIGIKTYYAGSFIPSWAFAFFYLKYKLKM